jgi:hypothetical protein
MPGVFAAGNVVHVYDLVDWVAAAGFVAGKAAAKYAAGKPGQTGNRIRLKTGENIRYIVPQFFNLESLVESGQRVQMRVQYPVEERVWVEVLHGQDLVVRQALRYVRPAEMVTLEIPQKAYNLLQDGAALNLRIVKR